MEVGASFVDAFHVDLPSKIFALLDDPPDLVRATAVSRTWRNFVISNSLCKNICLGKVPQFTYVSYGLHNISKLSNLTSDNGANWRTLEKEHKIFSALLEYFSEMKESPKYLLAFPMGASSTDRDPPVTIINTLNPSDCSYWSSKGRTDPNEPEHLLYRLNSSISILNEICIQPLKALWEAGNPVYSPKAVRFHMGHPKSIADVEIDICNIHEPCLEKYEWTYTSPQFPMIQNSNMQIFKLSEPVCVGGVIQIELLGRAQKDSIDGLFYIRLGHVKFMGLSLEPDFYAEMYSSGELQLTCNDKTPNHGQHVVAVEELENDMGPDMCEEMCVEMAEGLFDFLYDDDEE